MKHFLDLTFLQTTPQKMIKFLFVLNSKNIFQEDYHIYNGKEHLYKVTALHKVGFSKCYNLRKTIFIYCTVQQSLTDRVGFYSRKTGDHCEIRKLIVLDNRRKAPKTIIITIAY
jgi:hypothetical protein